MRRCSAAALGAERIPVSGDELCTTVFNAGQGPEAVIFEFEDPLGAIERHTSLLERHWLEREHLFQNSKLKPPTRNRLIASKHVEEIDEGGMSGLGIGIALGVLHAPANGQATRDKLKKRMSTWFGRFESDGVSARHDGNESQRDPEARRVKGGDREAIREKMMDKTLADSFPTNDPPSSIPDPSGDSLS